jgi:hypothetical protein
VNLVVLGGGVEVVLRGLGGVSCVLCGGVWCVFDKVRCVEKTEACGLSEGGGRMAGVMRER